MCGLGLISAGVNISDSFLFIGLHPNIISALSACYIPLEMYFSWNGLQRLLIYCEASEKLLLKFLHYRGTPLPDYVISVSAYDIIWVSFYFSKLVNESSSKRWLPSKSLVSDWSYLRFGPAKNSVYALLIRIWFGDDILIIYKF